MGSVGGWVVGLLLVAGCIPSALGVGDEAVGRGRLLLGFRETMGNASFQCSPSGPCLPCLYSEKNDDKYRCSETGYRVPLKCVETQDGLKEKTSNKIQRRLSSLQDHKVNSVPKKLVTAITNLRWRRLLDDSSTTEDGRRPLDDSSTLEDGKQSYITYRSCVPADGEEKLSVLGFEVIMVCLLLISGTVVYLRQKHTAAMPGAGAVRMSTNLQRF